MPLIKSPAAKIAQYKGMILFNFGGPGVSTIDQLLSGSDYLRRVTGDEYDLIAWEPRGVGYSNPMATCFEKPGPKFPRDRGINQTLDQLSNDEKDDTEEWLQAVKTFDTSCMKEMGNSNTAGPHMNTGVIAHDVLTILNAFASTEASHELHDASLLNYWGFSYGTFIGQTFASMFPDRIGRVVLDGVVDPDDYVSGTWLTSNRDTDDSFLTFFLSCYAAGSSCRSSPLNCVSFFQLIGSRPLLQECDISL